jgi:hypothetical protein
MGAVGRIEAAPYPGCRERWRHGLSKTRSAPGAPGRDERIWGPFEPPSHTEEKLPWRRQHTPDRQGRIATRRTPSSSPVAPSTRMTSGYRECSTRELRSPHAHARMVRIDTSVARALPGGRGDHGGVTRARSPIPCPRLRGARHPVRAGRGQGPLRRRGGGGRGRRRPPPPRMPPPSSRSSMSPCPCSPIPTRR